MGAFTSYGHFYKYFIQNVCRCAYATYDDSADGGYARGSPRNVQPPSWHGGPGGWGCAWWGPPVDDGPTHAHQSPRPPDDGARGRPGGYDEAPATPYVWRPQGPLAQSSSRAQLKTCILIERELPIYRYNRRITVTDLWISNAARKFRSIDVKKLLFIFKIKCKSE